eukprot:maker-scaffold_14-snap-gene-7.23-mRNA-1 protein AED:0.06 eAED:0.06 QI:0/1/0.83/1/1/1/6/79/802
MIPGYDIEDPNQRKLFLDPGLKKRISNLPIPSSALNLVSEEEFPKLIGGIIGCGVVFTFLLHLNSTSLWFIGVVLTICALGSAITLYLCAWLLSKPDGTEEMRKISEPIREGAEGFLEVQYSTVKKFSLLVAGAIFTSFILGDEGSFMRGFYSAATFLLGAGCSALAGYISMWVSAQTNVRVTAAATESYSKAFNICFRGGAFSAILSLTLCVSGVSLTYIIVYMTTGSDHLNEVPTLMTGLASGASFVALFQQLGGGIYTKAADVGSDLVGKVELSLAEDDPRNGGVIADLVGDLVGDCVGSSADVFESVTAEIIGAMILAATVAKDNNVPNPVKFTFFPLMVHAFDIVVSSIGIFYVNVGRKEDEEIKAGKSINPMDHLKKGYVLSLSLGFFCFLFTCRTMLYTEEYPSAWKHYVGCGLLGMLTSICFILSTQYYTDYVYPPVRQIAESSVTGHATNIITGIALGLKSTVVPCICISVAVLCSYHLGKSSGMCSNEATCHNAGLLGTAVATMGLLSSAGYILAQNNYGPIADNAGGIAEMSNQEEHVRDTTDILDACGNVTKAITKGYSIGSAALACFVLFSAFLDEVEQSAVTPVNFSVDLVRPEVVIGGLLGMMEIFLLSGMAIAAVGKTAGEVVKEVRRQFRTNPGILEGTEKPNYKVTIEIVTKAALREMQLPAIIAIAFPTFLGLFFRFVGEATEPEAQLGVKVLGGFSMFGTVAGILMGMFFDTAGGAWDNAKKYIEMGNFGGKGSEAHKAAVTGDTTGDPFKDTAGPTIHVVIKLLGNTLLVLAPLFVSNVTH